VKKYEACLLDCNAGQKTLSKSIHRFRDVHKHNLSETPHAEGTVRPTKTLPSVSG